MQAALHLALWQTPLPAPSAGGRLGLQALAAAAGQAAERGCDWLIGPEMGLTGYAIGAEAVCALAEPCDGPMAQAVAALARQHGLGIVYGFPEACPGRQPFNAVQAVDRHGLRLACYRKTHLYGKRDRTQFSAGDRAPAVFHSNGWALGLLICYDVEFPEPVRLLALQGADAVLVPTANMADFDEVPNCLVPARACENRLALAYANACGHEDRVHYGGLSTLCGPRGEVMARAGSGPALLCGTLERQLLRAARLSSPLPDRRPDLYAGLGPEPDQKSVWA